MKPPGDKKKGFRCRAPHDDQDVRTRHPRPAQRTMLLLKALPLPAALPWPRAGVRKAASGRADDTVGFNPAATHAPTLLRRAR